jgi:hypothetical protein
VLGRAAIFGVSAAATWIFLINLCSAIFQCGCGWLWSAAADHCNIHAPNMHHCPMCSIGDAGFNAIALSIITIQAVVSFGPWRWRPLFRFLIALAVFPLLGTAIGVGLGLYMQYWK